MPRSAGRARTSAVAAQASGQAAPDPEASRPPAQGCAHPSGPLRRVTSRALAVLAALAVVAGGAIAGVRLATRGAPHRGGAPAVVVDEDRGRVGRVVLGERRADVVAVLGRPRRDRLTGGAGGETLVYPHLVVRLAGGRVASATVDDPRARTLRSVGIGFPLAAVRAAYRAQAICSGLPEGELQRGGDPEHAFCTVRVPAGTLRLRPDPIATITLAATAGRR